MAAQTPPSRAVPWAAREAELGFRLELEDGFRAGETPTVAESADGRSVMVLPLFPRTPGREGCWRAVGEVQSGPEAAAAADVGALEQAARQGVGRSGRHLFLEVWAREYDCLLVQAEGPAVGPAQMARTALFAQNVFEKLAVSDPPPPPLRAEALLRRGWSLLEAGDASRASVLLEQALSLAPGLWRARLAAGLAAARRGKGFEEDVIRLLEPLLTARDTQRDGPAAEDHQRAQAEADELEPQQLRLVLSTLGLALLTQGRLEAALLRLVEADERFPGDPVVAYNIGCTLALLKRPDEAMEHVARALAAEPRLVEHAGEDPDLEGLRDRDDWRLLLKRLQPVRTDAGDGESSVVIP